MDSKLYSMLAAVLVALCISCATAMSIPKEVKDNEVALVSHQLFFNPNLVPGISAMVCLRGPAGFTSRYQIGFYRSAPAVTDCHCAFPDRWSCGTNVRRFLVVEQPQVPTDFAVAAY